MANLKVWSPWGLMPRDFFDTEDEFFNINEDVQVDVYEKDNEVIVKAKIAGYTKDNIDISLENGRLSIKGTTKSKKEEKDENKKYYRKEIRISSFNRSVDLPVQVKADKAEASFKDGILKITIPKSEGAKRKKININVKK